MQLIADFMMIAGAVGAAVYCRVLSQRLRKLTDLDGGLGAAIAVLSAQVSDMTTKIDEAKAAAQGSTHRLDKAVAQAEAAARRLELLLAALHDLPPDPAGNPRSTESAGLRTQGVKRASGFTSASRRERVE